MRATRKNNIYYIGGEKNFIIIYYDNILQYIYISQTYLIN